MDIGGGRDAPWTRVGRVAAREDAVFARGFSHGTHVVDSRVVLHDGAGVHDVAAILGHFPDDLLAGGPHILWCSEAQQVIRESA